VKRGPRHLANLAFPGNTAGILPRSLLRRRRSFLALLLWLLVGLRLRQGLALVNNAALRAKALVVGVLHDLAYVHRRRFFEIQHVIGDGVGRKPIFAVNLLAIGGELGEYVLAVAGVEVGHGFAVG